MADPATALSPKRREPDGALRSALERLAGEGFPQALVVQSFEDLCRLVVQSVRETVLQRTYTLKSGDQDALRMIVSNRRLLSLCDAGDELSEALPDLPSSDVADAVTDRLRAAYSPASEWSVGLFEQSMTFVGGGGSCSADMLQSRMSLAEDVCETTVPQTPGCLASLHIPAGPGADISQGDPVLVTSLKRISAAFAPSHLLPSVASTVVPRRATLIPLSQDHVALLSQTAGTIVLEAYRQSDAILAAQAWMDRQNRMR